MKGYQIGNSCILSQAGPMDRVLRRGRCMGIKPGTFWFSWIFLLLTVFFNFFKLRVTCNLSINLISDQIFWNWNFVNFFSFHYISSYPETASDMNFINFHMDFKCKITCYFPYMFFFYSLEYSILILTEEIVHLGSTASPTSG